MVVRTSGLAKKPDKTNLSVPSVIVGINFKPLLRIKQIVLAIGHEGFAVA